MLRVIAFERKFHVDASGLKKGLCKEAFFTKRIILLSYIVYARSPCEEVSSPSRSASSDTRRPIIISTIL